MEHVTLRPTGCLCVYCMGTRDDLAEYAGELELKVAELERWKPIWQIIWERLRVERSTWG